MVVYELETLLSIPNLYCIYLVDYDTYITLRTLLENFDNKEYLIPSIFRKYISMLINLHSSSKKSVKPNIFVKTSIQKSHALKIKPLRPIFSRLGNTYRVEDGISIVGDDRDLTYDKSNSPFGERSFGEDRGNGFLNPNQTTFNVKFNPKIAVQQLKDNIHFIRSSIGASSESIWVVGRVDRPEKTELAFANILGTTEKKNIDIAKINYSEKKPTENWKVQAKIKADYEAAQKEKAQAAQKEKEQAAQKKPPPLPPKPSVLGSQQTWYIRKNANDKTFYVNKDTNETLLERPRTAGIKRIFIDETEQKPSATESSSGDVWERLVNIREKKYYYYNTSTKVKQEELPTSGTVKELETINDDKTQYKIGKGNWNKFPKNKKYYYKYLKYKQKYLEAKKLYGEQIHDKELVEDLQVDELEGGGSYTYIFCPEKIYSKVQEIFSPTFKFNNKDFFLFCMGPKSFYTEEKSKKLCRCWGGCIENFWEKGLGTQYRIAFRSSVAREQIGNKMPNGNISLENNEQIPQILRGRKLTDYRHFSIESNKINFAL